MSDDSQEEDKTEAPTPQTLERAAEQGDIALSGDVATTLAMLGMLAGLLVLGPAVLRALVHSTADALDRMAHPDLHGVVGPAQSVLAGWMLALVSVPGLLAAVSLLAQTQGRTWSDRVMPDLSRLFSLDRLTHTFGREGLIMLAFKMLRMVLMTAAVWWAMRGHGGALREMLDMAPAPGLQRALGLLERALWAVLGTVAVTAPLEWFIGYHQHQKRHRMTREEIKRQHKEDEGDPQLKGRRRSRMREMVRNRVKQAVPTATVVLVNPTHVAVALRYRKGTDKAPTVVAKGKGALATVIRELARENGVTIVEDIPLARMLYKRVKVGREVPADTFRAVAAVLAVVMKARRG